MLGHQFGQNLVLGLDLLLQLGDPLLLGRMVWPCFRLKCSRAFLEELLLPAVEDRGLETALVTQFRDRAPAPTNAASEWRPSLPASYVRLLLHAFALRYLNAGTPSAFPAEPEQSMCVTAGARSSR